MKKILVTAAALTLGTSAFAWTDMHEGIHSADRAQASVVPAAFADWSDPTVEASIVPAAFASWSDPSVATGDKGEMDSETFADADIKSKAMVGGVTAASAYTYAEKSVPAVSQTAKTDTGGLTWAEADIKTKAMVGGVATASAESWQGAKTDTDGMVWAEADIKSKDMVGGMTGGSTAVGMGGPIEAQGYPACRPGAGDDNCIQLYERGVRDELAAYKASDGPAIGMGGPFEPAADTKPAGPAPSSDGPKVPNDDGEAAADGTDAGDDPHAGHDMNASKPGATATPTPNGVGGPIEARTDYPACSRTVTDSCIQSR